MGPTDLNGDLYNIPSKYSFVHNFKVHCKRGVMQALANKLDISITATNPQLPSTQQVMDEFNERMKSSIIVSNTMRRYAAASYHVTQVEYKESFAFYDPKMAPQAIPQAASTQPSSPSSPSLYCRKCGAALPSDSKFCNKCGTPVA